MGGTQRRVNKRNFSKSASSVWQNHRTFKFQVTSCTSSGHPRWSHNLQRPPRCTVVPILFKVYPIPFRLSRTLSPRLSPQRLTSIAPQLPSADLICYSSCVLISMVSEVRPVDLLCYLCYLSWTLFPVVSSAHFLRLNTLRLTWNAKGTQIHCVQYNIASTISIFRMVTTPSKLRSCSGVLTDFLDLWDEWVLQSSPQGDIGLPFFPRLWLLNVQLMCRLQGSGSPVKSPPKHVKNVNNLSSQKRPIISPQRFVFLPFRWPVW